MLASDGGAGEMFGGSVSISGIPPLWGLYADIRGAAYIFSKAVDGTWSQSAKVTTSDGAGDNYFGLSVAISGDTAIVGASGDDVPGIFSGSAYIFTKAVDGCC